MRKAYFYTGLAVLAVAFACCDGGDGGGTTPTPSGGGAGIWVVDKDPTVHKFSFAGGALRTVDGFV